MKCHAYILTLAFVLCWQLYQAQFREVFIEGNSPSSELAIAINPLHPKEVICATSDGLYMSKHDTARNWKQALYNCRKLTNYQNPLAYWNNSDRCFVHIVRPDTAMMDVTFLNSALVPQSNCYPLNLARGKMIKRLRVYSEQSTGSQHAVWTQLGSANGDNKKHSSFIMYAFSSKREWGWNRPIRISTYGGDTLMGDSTLMGATCCTGPDHEVFVAWAAPQGLMFRNLADENMSTEKMILPLKNGWQYTIGNNVKSNGLPTMACDNSKGEHRGRIYICWSDERHGVHNKNVFLIYSDDKGQSWTEPIVVTYRPNHKEQFMPYMTLDQSTGYIYILYYDQQNVVDENATDLYLAQSKNGGLKFDYYKVNDRPIEPHATLFFGNSLGLSAVDNIVRPAWMQTDKKNKSSVYTALIDEKTLTQYNQQYAEDIEIEKTFSWNDKIKINFFLKTKSAVSAVITEPLEPGFEKVIFKNKKMKRGKNSFAIDTKKLGIKKGNYTLTLYHHKKNSFVWLLEE